MARGGGRGGGGSGRGGGGFGGGSRGGGSSFGGSRGGGRRVGGGSRGRVRGGGGSSTNQRPSSGGRNYGYGRSYRPRPFFGGYGYGGYGGFGRRRYRRRGGCGGCGLGCLPSLMFISLLLVLYNFAWSFIPGIQTSSVSESVSVKSSTIEREPIEKGLVNETEYFQENITESSDVWINDPYVLEGGLKYFYDKTNVQPFVYITDNINGDPNPTLDEIDEFSAELYDELFTDEAHLLLVHFENYASYDHEYSYHTIYGSQAKILMDQEAESILFDYLDYNYPRDMTEEELFSKSFEQTADRIMEVTRSPWIPAAMIAGAAVILVVLYNWWRGLLNKPKDEEQTKKKDDNDRDFEEFDF